MSFSYEDEIKYQGYKIKVVRDDIPENPFEAWDGLPPTYVSYGRNGTRSYGGLDLYPPELTRDQLKANRKEILRQTSCRNLLHLIDDYAFHSRNSYQDAVDAVNDAIGQYVESLTVMDKMSLLTLLYAMAGIVSLNSSVSGYSQGDYTDVFVVASPEWIEKTGAVVEKPEDLQPTVDLYGHWAFGDVYGFVVKDPDGMEVDSCWGFYGFDHSKSGLESEAKAAIDREVSSRRKQRLKKLKALIKAHAPLWVRQEKLA